MAPKIDPEGVPKRSVVFERFGGSPKVGKVIHSQAGQTPRKKQRELPVDFILAPEARHLIKFESFANIV